ncbi:MAG: amino acid ABC transporter substrate-binding protein [Defluviicoccus sp.]
MNRVLLAGLAVLLCWSQGLAADDGGTLARIRASGKMVIAHREASPPFSFIDDQKRPAGYAVDLCLRIAKAVKDHLGLAELGIEYLPVTAENRLQTVAQGAADIECGNTTNTLSRQQTVDFTNTIFITGASLLARPETNITTLGDLRGKSITVVEGTTTEQVLTARLKRELIDATVVTVKDHSAGVEALEAGTAAAHAGDQLVLVGLAKAAKKPGHFALASEIFSYEPYALAVRRNDADFRLVANRELAQLYRSGEVGEIYTRWFGDWGGKPSQLLLAMFALNALPE